MKQNGNDKRTGEYYLGLDVGTNSVGWAAADTEYNLLRFKGNSMWGVRLFDEAQDASSRRSKRISRRRLERRNERLRLLELLFSSAICKKDPNFFRRLEESSLWIDDKTDKACRFSLFNDPGFNDKDYHRRYPTVYHLRRELMASDEPHDIRLVFLALHHIMKNRGHFLYDIDADDKLYTTEDAISELTRILESDFDTVFNFADRSAFISALERGDLGVNAKQKLLISAWGGADGVDASVSLKSAIDLLAGKSGINLSALFSDTSLADAEIEKISLKSDLDEHYDVLCSVLGDRMELLSQLKSVFDAARLSQMLKGFDTISESKVALYEKNRIDLRLLKKYVRSEIPGKYKEIFTAKKDKLNNFAAYSGYRNRSGDHSCTQEDFCKYLGKLLPEPAETNAEMQRIFREIKDGVFLSKLRSRENGVIPYQLQRRELTSILNNAAHYLHFLLETDEDGYTVSDKIRMVFEFRIPYYVGPLNKNAGSAWAVRFPGKDREKVYPWNFGKVIDTAASSEKFIENLVGRCTYTGERVLPKDSLLYSEFMLLNELNSLQVNGYPIPVQTKQEIVRDLFETSRKKVSKKQIRNYLLSRGCITADDVISGIDEQIKTTLRSFLDFHEILEKTGDREMVEDIIRHLLIFGNDPAMLKKWLRKNTHGLDERDYVYICRLKYSEWGRLSDCLLTEILSADPDEGTGEARSIMDLMRGSCRNLMQLLSDRYDFAAQAEAHRQELFGSGQTLADRLDSMYVAPAVRRSIRQTLKIVDEIVDIRKSVPKKIFIEMARDSAKEMKGKRTESRKAKLLALYAGCREQAVELLPRLEQEDENRLQSDKLYLYYTQFGKCMYSGEPIDLDALMDGRLFDIDHIFPRSRIKDNSLENRVVVKNTLNREKTNVYPISADIRKKMRPYWDMLRKAGMIGEKKYDRLTRSSPLTEDELASFVARQLVETRQSTKALTLLLQERYGEHSRIIFSKAGNVSDYRHDFDMLKCREVNDLHHAKDAYLNIVVGNVFCTKFTDRFFANIRSENYSLNQVYSFDVPGAWKKEGTIKTVRRMMAKNNPIVTRMPREVKGQLYDQQIMSAGKGQLEKKTGLDITKYGGYNKLTGTYYFAVEHTAKGKRIRTIEPVYLYKQETYEKDPLAYCTEILGLTEPVIICREIRADSLLEVDGSRLYISGRTGDYYVCEHAYQLAIDPQREKLIRALRKYADRCAARRAEFPVSVYDGITAEGCEDLYCFFLNKLKAGIYHRLLSNMEKDLNSCKDAFLQLSLHDQALVLLEILKAFRCNPQNANLTALCGKGTVGRVKISKKLSGCKTALLLHQSPTGLYEYKEDLLQ